MSIITELRESTEHRTYFGHDKHAINKHSTRRYEYLAGGCHVCNVELDKTCDGIPPFFCAWLLSGAPLSPLLRVAGLEYWGDGMSWKRAEGLLKESLDYKYRDNYFEGYSEQKSA